MRVYTTREVMAHLGISSVTVTRWTRNGKLRRIAQNQYVIPDEAAATPAETGRRASRTHEGVSIAEPVDFREVGEGFFHEAQGGYVFSSLPGTRKACLLPRATVEGMVSD
jgi:hypothetical protein